MTETDIIVRVVKAIADADKVDIGELDPLYTYIEPGILADIAERETGEWSFTFQYADHQVTITHDEQIFVDGVAHTPEEVTW